MSFYPDRIEDLKVILTRVVAAATLFDEDGISVRFINWQPPEPAIPPTIPLSQYNNIRDEAFIDRLLQQTPFQGKTPIGGHLQERILSGLLEQVQQGQLVKPVLVIAITDGRPQGEPDNTLRDVIRDTSAQLSRNPRYGPGAISFEIAQVGNDDPAREFLAQLDSDPLVGKLIDCTSSERLNTLFRRSGTLTRVGYEHEQGEMKNANPPVDLTPDLWVCVLT